MRFQAAVLREYNTPLSIESLRLKGLRDTDVVVRIAATSLCHTDLEAVTGQLGIPLPIVPGHEAAGIVEWIGSAVRRCKPGDHAILSWNPHCGECFYCGNQQRILCRQYRDRAASAFHFDGQPRFYCDRKPTHQLMYTGSFAELTAVSEDSVVPITKDMPLDRACLIGCGVMTGVGAVINIAKVEAGSSVSVVGCGAVGLSVVQGARMAAAERIIAIDRDADKLELAKALGATHTLLADDSLLELNIESTHGRGADYVFEAAGNPQAFQASLDLARPGGKIVWLGKLAANESLPLRWGSLTGEKNIVRASYGGAVPMRDFPLLVDAYLNGRLKLDGYISSRIRLGEINAALDRLSRGLEIRSVIQF